MDLIKNPEEIEDAGKFYNFSVDAALFRELGERLVGKPHVALAELVKNSYDADARKVVITFGDDYLSVTDNGHGMSKEEFLSFWMRVGTTHKQNAAATKELKRQVTGSKGVGRLSAQFLGERLTLKSISDKHSSTGIKADVDWSNARNSGELIKAGALVKEITNPKPLLNEFKRGTQVRIDGLKQDWEEEALQELAKELWFLRPPRELIGRIAEADDFNVILKGVSPEKAEIFAQQMKKALDNWIATIEGNLVDGKSRGEAVVTVKFRDGDKHTATYPSKLGKLDSVDFKIFIFNLSGRQPGDISVHVARDYFKRFGGIHIYDDGFRLPFYGGEEQDWLQLETDHAHRLNKSELLPEELRVKKGLNDLPTNGRIFGIARVSTATERKKANESELLKGDYLNVQVTRDRLIDNNAFSDLTHVVRWAIDFYANRSYERRQREIASKNLEIPKLESSMSEIRQELHNLQMSAPAQMASEILNISNRFLALEKLEAQKQSALSRERILLGALATTGMAAIALEHELGKELTALNEIIENINQAQISSTTTDLNPVLESVEQWASRSARARRLFSPLMNEVDREQSANYKAKKVVSKIASNSEVLLRNITINLDDIPTSLTLPKATFAAWNAVFQNVLINSINAMIHTSERNIRCYGYIRERDGVAALIVEDTGVGVTLDNSDELFKPFVRKLEIPDERKALGLGGVGLGLTIVKMVADALNCKVEFIQPSFEMKTAFKLEWKLPQGEDK